MGGRQRARRVLRATADGQRQDRNRPGCAAAVQSRCRQRTWRPRNSSSKSGRPTAASKKSKKTPRNAPKSPRVRQACARKAPTQLAAEQIAPRCVTTRRAKRVRRRRHPPQGTTDLEAWVKQNCPAACRPVTKRCAKLARRDGRTVYSDQPPLNVKAGRRGRCTRVESRASRRWRTRTPTQSGRPRSTCRSRSRRGAQKSPPSEQARTQARACGVRRRDVPSKRKGERVFMASYAAEADRRSLVVEVPAGRRADRREARSRAVLFREQIARRPAMLRSHLVTSSPAPAG